MSYFDEKYPEHKCEKSSVAVCSIGNDFPLYPKQGDVFFNTCACNLFIYIGNKWITTVPKVNGPTGPQGPAGPIGPPGPP
jgi:hypothetical protein